MTERSQELRQLEERRALLEGRLASAGADQQSDIRLELAEVDGRIRDLCNQPARCCFACSGTGRISGKGRCPVCRGAGQLSAAGLSDARP